MSSSQPARSLLDSACFRGALTGCWPLGAPFQLHGPDGGQSPHGKPTHCPSFRWPNLPGSCSQDAGWAPSPAGLTEPWQIHSKMAPGATACSSLAAGPLSGCWRVPTHGKWLGPEPMVLDREVKRGAMVTFHDLAFEVKLASAPGWFCLMAVSHQT